MTEAKEQIYVTVCSNCKYDAVHTYDIDGTPVVEMCNICQTVDPEMIDITEEEYNKIAKVIESSTDK